MFSSVNKDARALLPDTKQQALTETEIQLSFENLFSTIMQNHLPTFKKLFPVFQSDNIDHWIRLLHQSISVGNMEMFFRLSAHPALKASMEDDEFLANLLKNTVFTDHIEIFQFLVRKNRALFQHRIDGQSLLMTTLTSQSYNLAVYLIKTVGIDSMLLRDKSLSVRGFKELAHNNQLSLLNLIFTQYSKHELFTKHSNNLLRELIVDNDLPSVRCLLALPQFKIDLSPPESYTVFHLAAQGGDVAMVKFLLSVFPKFLNVASAYKSFKIATPLYLAIRHGHAEIVRFLLNIPGIEIDAHSIDLAERINPEIFTLLTKKLLGSDAELRMNPPKKKFFKKINTTLNSMFKELKSELNQFTDLKKSLASLRDENVSSKQKAVQKQLDLCAEEVKKFSKKVKALSAQKQIGLQTLSFEEELDYLRKEHQSADEASDSLQKEVDLLIKKFDLSNPSSDDEAKTTASSAELTIINGIDEIFNLLKNRMDVLELRDYSIQMETLALEKIKADEKAIRELVTNFTQNLSKNRAKLRALIRAASLEEPSKPLSTLELIETKADKTEMDGLETAYKNFMIEFNRYEKTLSRYVKLCRYHERDTEVTTLLAQEEQIIASMHQAVNRLYKKNETSALSINLVEATKKITRFTTGLRKYAEQRTVKIEEILSESETAASTSFDHEEVKEQPAVVGPKEKTPPTLLKRKIVPFAYFETIQESQSDVKAKPQKKSATSKPHAKKKHAVRQQNLEEINAIATRLIVQLNHEALTTLTLQETKAVKILLDSLLYYFGLCSHRLLSQLPASRLRAAVSYGSYKLLGNLKEAESSSLQESIKERLQAVKELVAIHDSQRLFSLNELESPFLNNLIDSHTLGSYATQSERESWEEENQLFLASQLSQLEQEEIFTSHPFLDAEQLHLAAGFLPHYTKHIQTKLENRHSPYFFGSAVSRDERKRVNKIRHLDLAIKPPSVGESSLPMPRQARPHYRGRTQYGAHEQQPYIPSAYAPAASCPSSPYEQPPSSPLYAAAAAAPPDSFSSSAPPTSYPREGEASTSYRRTSSPLFVPTHSSSFYAAPTMHGEISSPLYHHRTPHYSSSAPVSPHRNTPVSSPVYTGAHSGGLFSLFSLSGLGDGQADVYADENAQLFTIEF